MGLAWLGLLAAAHPPTAHAKSTLIVINSRRAHSPKPAAAGLSHEKEAESTTHELKRPREGSGGSAPSLPYSWFCLKWVLTVWLDEKPNPPRPGL